VPRHILDYDEQDRMECVEGLYLSTRAPQADISRLQGEPIRQTPWPTEFDPDALRHDGQPHHRPALWGAPASMCIAIGMPPTTSKWYNFNETFAKLDFEAGSCVPPSTPGRVQRRHKAQMCESGPHGSFEGFGCFRASSFRGLRHLRALV